MMGLRKHMLPPLGFKWRVFIALVGISSVASLIIGAVLYYFAQSRLIEAENNLLIQRSRTANAGAGAFLEGLRSPEDQTLPPPDSYAEELVRVVADPTGLGLVYVGPGGNALAARDGSGESASPEAMLDRLGVPEEAVERAQGSSSGDGRLVRGTDSYVTVWPLSASGEEPRGVIVYDAPQDELEETLAYLRFGVLGAILTSVVLGSAASLLMTRQITRPLSDTRDAAIRIASGDYGTPVPATSRDELGELARAVNYMAEEIEHYVGEINEQKRRLEAVLEASPEALVATDTEERVTMANPAAGRILGVRANEQGMSLEELGVNEEILRCARKAAAEGYAVEEVEVGDKVYWAYAAKMERPDDSGSEQNGSGGDDSGTILAVRDITEHRALERSKTAFLSDVSHELRTPLTTIQSAVSLLERAEERLDPLEHRALELAEGELRRIRGMVEELLTLAQMDSWQYSLKLETTELSRIIEKAIDSVEAKAERFGIEIHLYNAAVQCTCDTQKLYQVFLNLLDNAVKYSETGARVDITVGEDKEDFIVVRIKDTGFGIPEEDLPHLFERFYRVDKNRSRSTGGSGLGLAISKQIVELHGGRISVASEPGVGSTFTVRLPKIPQPSVTHAV